MRSPSLLLLLSAVSCAEASLPPTFPAGDGQRAIVEEQALIGLHGSGDAAVAELIAADGQPPKLALLKLDHDRGDGRPLLAASPEVAQAVAADLIAKGRQAAPLLAAAVATRWPEAAVAAAAAGFKPAIPTAAEPGRRRWSVRGAGVPLSIRTAEVDGPRSSAVLLGERLLGRPGGDEVELSRMPVLGVALEPEVYVAGRTVWVLAGSVEGGDRRSPLRRTVGLRRGSIARGEAELHNLHGLTDYAAGDLDAARREFARALLVDGDYFDALYNSAAVAALAGRDEEAIDFLYRAAKADPGRVQVLGRTDEDLRVLRRRAEVRGLLGIRRSPPQDLDPRR